MMNIKKAIGDILRDETFVHNQTAAYKRNATVLKVVLVGSIFCFLLLFATSFFAEAYAKMRFAYGAVAVIYISLLILSFVLSEKAAHLLAYALQIVFVLFATYNSAFVWYDDVCVMILSELFIFTTLFLDKNWRITAVTVFSAALYLTIIAFYKTPSCFADELVNVICFTLLSIIVGTFTRGTQIKNFDNIEQLRLSQEHYELALKHNGGVICEYNVKERCLTMKSDAADIFESPKTVYHVPYGPIENGKISPESCEDYIRFYEDITSGSKTGTAEFQCLTAHGWRWQKAIFSTIFADSGEPVSAVISFSDITSQHEENRIIRKQAETDGLTEIYNRAAAVALIQKRLANDARTFCVLLIADLDDLKIINDTLGHPQGDNALQTLAKILQSHFRKTDIVGRIGGDEFIAFLDGVGSKADVEKLLTTLMKEITEVKIGINHDYPLSASIGIAQGHSGENSFDELYDLADKALYHAKRNGKKQFAFYSEEM